jgi:putative endonuclease
MRLKGAQWTAFIYILRCADDAFYTGITRRSPEERESEHNLGLDPNAWTFSRRPVVLVWSTHFDRIDDAIATERRIKGWRREKKLALVRGEYDRLPGLASRKRVP